MKNKVSSRNLNVTVLPFYEPRVPYRQTFSEWNYPRMAENLFAGPSNCWNQISSRYSKARNSSGVNNSQLQLAAYTGDKQLTWCSCDSIFICTDFIEGIYICIREIIPPNKLIQSLKITLISHLWHLSDSREEFLLPLQLEREWGKKPSLWLLRQSE